MISRSLLILMFTASLGVFLWAQDQMFFGNDSIELVQLREGSSNICLTYGDKEIVSFRSELNFETGWVSMDGTFKVDDESELGVIKLRLKFSKVRGEWVLADGRVGGKWDRFVFSTFQEGISSVRITSLLASELGRHTFQSLVPGPLFFLTQKPDEVYSIELAQREKQFINERGPVEKLGAGSLMSFARVGSKQAESCELTPLSQLLPKSLQNQQAIGSLLIGEYLEEAQF